MSIYATMIPSVPGIRAMRTSSTRPLSPEVDPQAAYVCNQHLPDRCKKAQSGFVHAIGWE